MSKISIYLENKELSPASYYRLTQYFRDMPEVNIHSALNTPIYRFWHRQARIGRALFAIPLYLIYYFTTLFNLLGDWLFLQGDTIIISRVVTPHRLLLLHRLLIRLLSAKNTIIWDFDDNIIESGTTCRADFDFLSRYSDIIVVTSEFLQKLIKPQYRQKTKLLCTTDGDMAAVDFKSICEDRKNAYENTINLIWVGTASSLEHLQLITNDLDHAAKELLEKHNKQLCLHVVCNKPTNIASTYLQVLNIPWTRERAISEIIGAHIGIMPLADNSFTRGKGGFKLVQYLSAYLPVIASNVGFNKEIVTSQCGFLSDDKHTPGAWEIAILSLAANWERYKAMSIAARQRYDAQFSYQENKAFWLRTCQRIP